MIILNCLGSCLSRLSLLKGEKNLHGIYNGENIGIKIQYYLDKHNIALAMMPPPFDREQVEAITDENLRDKTRLRSMKQMLNKDTIKMLLESDAQYLIMDLYDFHNSFLVYKDTAFGTQAGEFSNTKLYHKVLDKLTLMSSFFERMTWVYYPLVDLFFERIMQKYDSEHIILNRFRSNIYTLLKNGNIKRLSDDFKMNYQCSDKYNPQCRALEDYIIKKYNPYVIDLSKYFMCDENYWGSSGIHSGHFERQFYLETYNQMIRIMTGETKEKYYNKPGFFNPERDGYEEDSKRKFDTNKGLEFLNYLIDTKDPLALNILEKLYIKMPNQEFLEIYETLNKIY